MGNSAILPHFPHLRFATYRVENNDRQNFALAFTERVKPSSFDGGDENNTISCFVLMEGSGL